jgi:hypothetical protein
MRVRAPAGAPSEGPAPGICLLANLGYFGALVALAAFYLANDHQVLGFQDEHRLIAIAWVGSLGAVANSLARISRNLRKWNPSAAGWYLLGPLTGAVFGTIGYLIYIAVVEASVEGQRDGADVQMTPSTLGYLVAFAVGFREELFRDLLKRITDLLATAGGADVEPPSAPPDLTCEIGEPDGRDVTVSWQPSSDNIEVIGYNVYRDHWFLASVLVAPPDGNGQTASDKAKSLPANTDRPADGDEPRRISFVDRAVDVANVYLYSVTAVDRAGNESEPAGPVRAAFKPRREPNDGGPSSD